MDISFCRKIYAHMAGSTATQAELDRGFSTICGDPVQALNTLWEQALDSKTAKEDILAIGMLWGITISYASENPIIKTGMLRDIERHKNCEPGKCNHETNPEVH